MTLDNWTVLPAIILALILPVVVLVCDLSPAKPPREPTVTKRKAGNRLEAALTVTAIGWIAFGLGFYGICLTLEYQKHCDHQRTSQLTYECRVHYKLVQ